MKNPNPPKAIMMTDRSILALTKELLWYKATEHNYIEMVDFLNSSFPHNPKFVLDILSMLPNYTIWYETENTAIFTTKNGEYFISIDNRVCNIFPAKINPIDIEDTWIDWSPVYAAVSSEDLLGHIKNFLNE